jgi:hypothetical protein
MERRDLSLIAESYEEVKFNLYVEKLLIEGKSVDEITDHILSEGIFSRMMSRIKSGLGDKDKRDRLKTMVKGKAAQLGQDALGSKYGQKAMDLAQQGLRGGQKLAVKGASALGMDPNKVKQSSAFKGVDNLRKGMQDTSNLDANLAQNIEKGRDAASGFRSDKLTSLLASQKPDIDKMFNNFQTSVLTLNRTVNNVFNDLKKIGGVTTNPQKIQALKNDIRTSIILPFLQQDLTKPVDVSGLSTQVVTKITDFINKQKVSGGEGVGLRTKHKLDPNKISG